MAKSKTGEFLNKVRKVFSKEEPSQEEISFIERMRQGIAAATEEVRTTVEDVWKNNLRVKEDELCRKHEFEMKSTVFEFESKLAEKEAENLTYVKLINELQAQIENNQKAYQDYFHKSLQMEKYAAQLADQMEAVFKENGGLFQGFARIRDNIKLQNEELFKEDEKIRHLLGMQDRDNKLLLDKSKK